MLPGERTDVLADLGRYLGDRPGKVVKGHLDSGGDGLAAQRDVRETLVDDFSVHSGLMGGEKVRDRFDGLVHTLLDTEQERRTHLVRLHGSVRFDFGVVVGENNDLRFHAQLYSSAGPIYGSRPCGCALPGIYVRNICRILEERAGFEPARGLRP